MYAQLLPEIYAPAANAHFFNQTNFY